LPWGTRDKGVVCFQGAVLCERNPELFSKQQSGTRADPMMQWLNLWKSLLLQKKMFTVNIAWEEKCFFFFLQMCMSKKC